MSPWKLILAGFPLLVPSQNALKNYQLTRYNIVSGVTSVGNGGGFGEMQAVLINMQMRNLTKTCIEKPEICKLNFQEAGLVQSASEKNFHLKISTECLEAPVSAVTPGSATLAACAFYQKPQPSAPVEVLEFKEIAKWVLSARLMSQGSDFDSAYGLADKVFFQFRQQQEELLMSLDEGQALIRLLSITLPGGETQSLSIEGKSRAIELTSRVISELHCHVEKWRLNFPETQVLGSSQGMIGAKIQWTCGARVWKGQLRVFFELQTGDVDETSLQIQIVEKSPDQ